jgi:RimJ/RimL family protein N-acetyltransferase
MMSDVLSEAMKIRARRTQVQDIPFVSRAERDAENAPYVGQWTEQQHSQALMQGDVLHLLFEDPASGKAVGFAILTGLENPNQSIELKRIIITDKGRGFGREVLREIKRIAFMQYRVHRLWLDVRMSNQKAINLYRSEGFREEGVLRECICDQGRFESLMVMSMLEDEYLYSTGRTP